LAAAVVDAFVVVGFGAGVPGMVVGLGAGVPGIVVG
jgi:hypothetical protein